MDSLHIFFLILFLFMLCNMNTENFENNDTKYYVNCTDNSYITTNTNFRDNLKGKLKDYVDVDNRLLRSFYLSPICGEDSLIKVIGRHEKLDLNDPNKYDMFYPHVLYGQTPLMMDETITYKEKDNNILLDIKKKDCEDEMGRKVDDNCISGRKPQH